MHQIFRKMKQIAIAVTSVTIVNAFFLPTAKADALDVPYLANIQSYTNSMLSVVNQIPAYLANLPLFVSTWLATDNNQNDPVNWSTNWSNEQNWLSTLGTNALNNEANQIALQTSLLTSFFGASNISSGNPQYLNDLSYTTLLGAPLLSPDPRSEVNAALNYLTNASGLAVNYPIPSAGWRGNAQAQKNYASFYNTVVAVQTHNAYVLSRLYEDSKTFSNDTSMRKQLITQSSNSSWFSSVISNDLGWVLRQILLYASQNYVLMDQLVQTQKQMLSTIAMTNSLLIASSRDQANNLISKAQGGTAPQ